MSQCFLKTGKKISCQEDFHSFDSSYYSLQPLIGQVSKISVTYIPTSRQELLRDPQQTNQQQIVQTPIKIMKGERCTTIEIPNVIPQQQQSLSESFDFSQRTHDKKQKGNRHLESEQCNMSPQQTNESKLFNISYSKTQYHIASQNLEKQASPSNSHQLIQQSLSQHQQYSNQNIQTHNSIYFLSFIKTYKAFPSPSLFQDSPIQMTYEKVYFPTTKCRVLNSFKLQESQPNQIGDEINQIINDMSGIFERQIEFVNQSSSLNVNLHKIQQQQESYSFCKSGSIKQNKNHLQNYKQLAIDIQQEQKLPLQQSEIENSSQHEAMINSLMLSSLANPLKPHHINSSIYSKLEEIKLSNQYLKLQIKAKNNSLKKQNPPSAQITLCNNTSYSAKERADNKYYTNKEDKSPYLLSKYNQYATQYQTQRKFQKIPQFSIYEGKGQTYIGGSDRTVKDKKIPQKLKSSYKKDLILKRNRQHLITQYNQPIKLFYQASNNYEKSCSKDKKSKISILQRVSFNKKVSDFNRCYQHHKVESSFINISQEKSRNKSWNNKSANKQKIRLTIKQLIKGQRASEPESDIYCEYNKNEAPISSKIH